MIPQVLDSGLVPVPETLLATAPALEFGRVGRVIKESNLNHTHSIT